MDLLRFKNGLFDKYKKTVKGNSDITYQEACKKLTRNMLLAKKVESEHHVGSTLYQYGSLHFVVFNGKITWIKNRCKVPLDWKLNKKEYVRLSRELGIDDDVTVVGLYINDVKGKLRYWKNKLKWKIKGRKNEQRGVN